jgi:hypothetical protein
VSAGGRRRQNLLTRGIGRVRRELRPKEPSLSFELDAPSTTLLLAFGGIRGGLGVPVFEFFGVSAELEAKRMFVRDLRQSWYHRGLSGHTKGIDDTARLLQEHLDRAGVERLVVVGNSAGGYAALLLGTMLGADVSLCFGPQTLVDPDAMAAFGDRRWERELGGLKRAGELDARYSDLVTALPQLEPAGTRHEVYFDASFGLDRTHAERIGELAGVQLHPLDGGAHGIAQMMRESGELKRVLTAALTGSAS